MVDTRIPSSFQWYKKMCSNTIQREVPTFLSLSWFMNPRKTMVSYHVLSPQTPNAKQVMCVNLALVWGPSPSRIWDAGENIFGTASCQRIGPPYEDWHPGNQNLWGYGTGKPTFASFLRVNVCKYVKEKPISGLIAGFLFFLDIKGC